MRIFSVRIFSVRIFSVRIFSVRVFSVRLFSVRVFSVRIISVRISYLTLKISLSFHYWQPTINNQEKFFDLKLLFGLREEEEYLN